MAFKHFFALLILCLFCRISFAQSLDKAAILTRKQVPVLCYHQIRDWKPKDRKVDKDYIIPPATFRAHMKMLVDSGYHTISPDQLYDYLTKGAALPPKPVLLTFDDTNEDQYRVARPELLKYGFKGVFFIITGEINADSWHMDKQQVKQLSDDGNTIACHTRDHGNFKKFKDTDWVIQVDKVNKKLEAITGKPVKYFAYPYGLWSSKNLPELHKHGIVAAFQLTEPRDPNDPIMTIRRLIDCGYWDNKTFNYNLTHDFGRLRTKKG